jgi:hypothetical protein
MLRLCANYFGGSLAPVLAGQIRDRWALPIGLLASRQRLPGRTPRTWGYVLSAPAIAMPAGIAGLDRWDPIDGSPRFAGIAGIWPRPD